MNFEELTQVALLGTERQTLAAPQGNRPVDQLQAQLDLNRREETLLSCAALSSLHERIGSLPPGDTGLVAEPCPSEILPRMNEKAASLLLRLLGGEHTILLPEFLQLAANARQIAPPEALPSLLALGAGKLELREPVLPILGARGRWLAAQNSEWAYVTGAASEDESIWQVGEPPARLMFLQRLRRSQPARARELLAATWKEETPEDRARFIGVFEIGLSLDDESFLEAALDDKRKEVRRAASLLLGSMEGSAIVKRMVDRVKPLLTYVPAEAGGLLKLKKAKPACIEAVLPSECDKTMQRDGIEAKPPSGMGERAWWLMQMLEFVPLHVWTAEWGVQPGDVLDASKATEWKNELLLAWIRAAIRQKKTAWADDLFGVAFENRHFNLIGDLLSVMSPTTREARLSEMLVSSDAKVREFRGYLITNSKFGWSLPFSRNVLAWLKVLATEASNDWQLRSQIKDFVPHLAASLLAEVPSGWPTDSPAWEFWSKGMDEFLAVAQFRADMHAAFTH